MTTYRWAMRKTLDHIHRAYLASSEPAPHPAQWKRWLRRPYRRVDWTRYVEELRKW